MKATGIVRKIDDLGRFVIPKEIRKTMHIKEDDPLEIFIDNDCIILRKYSPACIFCGETEGVVTFQKAQICPQCISSIAAHADTIQE